MNTTTLASLIHKQCLGMCCSSAKMPSQHCRSEENCERNSRSKPGTDCRAGGTNEWNKRDHDEIQNVGQAYSALAIKCLPSAAASFCSILFPFILNNTTLQSSLNSRTRSPRVPLSLALNRKTNLPGPSSILAYVSDAEHIASNASSSRGAIHPCWQEIEPSLPLSCLREGNVWSKAECVKCKCKPLHSSHTFPTLSGSIAGLWLGDADPPNRWHISPTYVGKAQFWKSQEAGATWGMWEGQSHPSHPKSCRSRLGITMEAKAALSQVFYQRQHPL